MAGHNKWSKIKHKKGKADQQRGQAFSKVSKVIIHAAREGGGDPETNLSLKLAIDQAKDINMPKDVIQRAIDRGTGKGEDGSTFTEMIYEGYGPDGVPLLILVSTDNTNRSVADIRKILSTYNGSLGEPGSVKWQFNEKGLIKVKAAKMKKAEKHGQNDFEKPIDTETAMLEIMEVPHIEDIKEHQEPNEEFVYLYVYVPFVELSSSTKAIKELGYIVTESGPHFVYSQGESLTSEQKDKLSSLFSELEELDDVQEYWYP